MLLSSSVPHGCHFSGLGGLCQPNRSSYCLLLAVLRRPSCCHERCVTLFGMRRLQRLDCCHVLLLEALPQSGELLRRLHLRRPPCLSHCSYCVGLRGRIGGLPRVDYVILRLGAQRSQGAQSLLVSRRPKRLDLRKPFLLHLPTHGDDFRLPLRVCVL